MEFHFYMGKGPEVDALIAEGRQEDQKAADARGALLEEYGASSLLVRGKAVIGITYTEEQDNKILKFLKRDEFGYNYAPKKNSNAGKALAEKMQNPGLLFGWSDFLTTRLGIRRYAREGRNIFFSVAGFVQRDEGVILIARIPAVAQNQEGDPMPEIPPFLTEVKESVFLAVQGK